MIEAKELVGLDLEPMIASQVFHHSPLGMFVLERDGSEEFYIVAVNKAAQEAGDWRRHSAQSLIGKNITAIFDGAREAGLLDIYNEVLGTGTAQHLENLAYEDKEVPGGFFKLDIVPLADHRLLISFLNVTSQVSAENERLRGEMQERTEMSEALERTASHLRRAQKVACLGSYEMDPATGDVYLSEQARAILGVDVPHINTETVLTERVHPADHEAILLALEKASTTGEMTTAEYRIVLPGGEERWVWVQGNIKNGAEGGSGEILGVIQDITDRKSLESQLHHAQKMEAVGQLAAGVAHEINTPMQYVGDNTRFVSDALGDLFSATEALQRVLEQAKAGSLTKELIGQVEMLIEEANLEYLAEELPKAIEQSLGGITHVSRLVKAMKEFSHPGHDEKSMVDINHALETTVTVAKNEWKYVADIAWDLDASLDKVSGYPGELNQVFLNITVNAAHAIADVVAEGSGEKGLITISTCKVDRWAEVRIQDSGSGIPEAIRSRIFDPFYTTKEVGKGTGQGLAIAYSVVVDKHGGQISLESEVGKGTTFIIRLPLTDT